MTTETQAPGRANGSGDSAGPVVISPRAMEAFATILAAIPEAGEGGYEGILEQLATVENVADLDAPWRAEGMANWIGEPLEIRGLRRLESDYQGGLPFFLVVDAASLETGEKVTFTTGAVGVVAQLGKAYQLGAIPGWRVIPRQSERPSESGYYPQHLEVMRGRLASEG